MAEATGSAFLSKLGSKSIAEARKLSADAIQAATGGGLTFRPWPTAMSSRRTCTPCTSRQVQRHPVLLGHTSDETRAFGGASRHTRRF
jgi:hypothetical protein